MKKKNIMIIAIPVLVLAVSIPSVLFLIHKNKQQVDAARAAVVVHSSEITIETEAGTAGTTSPSMSDGNEAQETAAVVLHLFENPDKQTQQEIYDNEILIASNPNFLIGGLGSSASASIATSRW